MDLIGTLWPPASTAVFVPDAASMTVTSVEAAKMIFASGDTASAEYVAAALPPYVLLTEPFFASHAMMVLLSAAELKTLRPSADHAKARTGVECLAVFAAADEASSSRGRLFPFAPLAIADATMELSEALEPSL